MRNRKRYKKRADAELMGCYRNWLAISDYKLFYVWKGKRSFSYKENIISNILKGQNLTFYREVSFDMKKRFDFYIPLINLVIEYDGEQHFTSLREMSNDVEKEKILTRFGIKLIRYNKHHDLNKQILIDLIYHPVLKSAI